MQKTNRSDKLIKKEGKQKTQSDETTNKPSEALRYYIKIANLAPFNADLDFDADGSEQFNDWAEKHQINQYPKLYEHLSEEPEQGFDWVANFILFKSIRNFMKVFVEVAEEYRKECELNEKYLDLIRQKENPALITIVEPLLNGGTFVLHYPATTRWAYYSEKKRPGLAKRFFEAASISYKLTAENHHAVISGTGSLDMVEGTDLRRLKKCLQCSSIFWAYRLNTIFCSNKCSNFYHQREILDDSDRKAIANARRSHSRFNKQVDNLRKELKNAKTETKKKEINKWLLQAIDKRTKAAKKHTDLKKKLGKNK